MRPRRSVLYMPGANARAQQKATQLDCDGLIFDLEDAVAPAAKASARTNIVHSLTTTDYGRRERIVRVNGLDTPWGAADVAALDGVALDAVLFPKIESAAMVDAAAAALAGLQPGKTADAKGQQVRPQLWLMIESPRSILALEAIAEALLRANASCEVSGALVMGTSDLVQELRAQHVTNREPLLFALSRAVTVARAHGLDILDGVHLDFRNLDTFRTSCEQGRALGFDGRSLIHPGQVELANAIYGFSDAVVEHAKAVLRVWNEAKAQGLGVVELDGQLIENLHALEAQRVLAMSVAIGSQAIESDRD